MYFPHLKKYFAKVYVKYFFNVRKVPIFVMSKRDT
jgi:hypothetical protein